jgi:hypothetical protein
MQKKNIADTPRIVDYAPCILTYFSFYGVAELFFANSVRARYVDLEELTGVLKKFLNSYHWERAR